MPVRLPARPAVRLATDLALAALWGAFAWRYFAAFVVSPRASTFLFFVSESVVVALFLVRRPPRVVSERTADWLWALGGTAAGTLFLPGGRALVEALGSLVMCAGELLVTTGALSLGRSFGVVAADRGIRTGGAYAVVRHPMYAGYLLSYCGFILASASPWNTAVLCFAAVAVLARVHAEERLLAGNPGYAAYTSRVHWKLIPMVY